MGLINVHNNSFRGLASLLLLLLFSCSTPYQAPINDVGSKPGNTSVYLGAGANHRVNAGETLYSIAWMYDLDYAALARANQISAPYIIIPGQRLSLELSSASSTVGLATSASPPQQAASVSSTSPPRATGRPGVDTSSELLRWIWPADGNIVGRFSTTKQENKGIDISGKEGDKVLAAEAGEVVYAGSGLLRYGDLIIIKHNAQYLSAYAHNSELSVVEGDKVSRGQQIAYLGSTGINSDMLHFEIRLEGKPVDPLRYLPPR